MARNKSISPYLPNKSIEKYTDEKKRGKFGFPSDDFSNEYKENTASWHLQMVEAIWSLYSNNQTLFGASEAWQMAINRSYGRGLQDNSKYRKQLLELSTSDNSGRGGANQSDREGWMNISWDTVSEIPRLKKVFQGLIDGTIFKPTTMAIDENSSLAKQVAMYEMWLDAKGSAAEEELMALAGADPNTEKYRPESLDELQMLKDQGGIRLPLEANFDKALRSVFYESKYEKKIQPLLAEDLFENNVMAVRTIVNPFSQRVEQKYVDVAKMIAPYSRDTQYDDMPFFGHFYESNIKEVAAETGLDEDKIRSIATTYDNWNSNPAIMDMFSNVNNLDLGNVSNWNTHAVNIGGSVKVVVAEFEYLSKDHKTYLEKKDRNQQTRVIEKKEGGNKIVEYVTVYKCKWLVGTNIVWDYGRATDIAYDSQNKKPKINAEVVRLTGKSMVDLLIPAADMYCVNWFKFQNALAMAPPAGLAMEWQSMQNMMLQGQKLNPKDIIKLRMQTGSFLYKTTNLIGKPNSPMAIPFHELEGGIGRQFNEFQAVFEMFNQFSQRFTGFTDVAAAQNPDPNAPVKTTEMSYQATITALRPMFNAMALIKQGISQNVIRRIQVIAKWNKGGYKATFGEAGLELIKITAKECAATMGIMIEIINDAQQRAKIEQALLMAMKPQDGGPGLTVSQYMFVQRMLEEGNTKLAEMWLRHLEAQSIKQKNKSLEENAKAQSEQNMKAEQSKMQAEMALENMKHQNKMKEIVLEGAVLQSNTATQGEITLVNSVVDQILTEFGNQMKQEQQQTQQQTQQAPELAVA